MHKRDAHDPRPTIEEFYERNKPLFKTVSDGKEEITTAFGISAFPQAVLIDKESKVIYVGSVNTERLEKILDTVL